MTATAPTPTAFTMLPVVLAKAQATTGEKFPGAAALFAEADRIWEQEYSLYEALSKIWGMSKAADRVWKRRTAVSELARIFVAAL